MRERERILGRPGGCGDRMQGQRPDRRPRMSVYRIHEEHVEHSLDADRLQDAIDSHNMELTGERAFWPVALCLRDEAGRLCGGLTGAIWGGWLHVKVLWLEPSARGAGHGSRLLRAAEAYAYERGARNAHLASFTFQAPGFYTKHGYEPFGQLAEYPTGHAQVFLFKRLEGQRTSP
jgi:GNAT superfamily N-acetyltransferase